MRKRLPFYVGVPLFFIALLGWFVAQPLVKPLRRISPSLYANPENLQHHVTQLSTVFVPRDEAHPKMLDKVAVYIQKHFEAAGARVSVQNYKVNRDIYHNVIARFGPEAGELIIIGAHYDACEENPGADDNASGVAGLLELARMFQEKPPAVPVELVAYSTEEPPYFRTILMGSVAHAKSITIDTQPIQFMISLEMIGYFSDERGSQKYPMPLLKLFYPSRGNFIAIVSNMESMGLVRNMKRRMAEATFLSIRSINGPSWIPGIDFSDHRNYWTVGIPAVMITDTAFYRNPHYHKPTDTPDRLDYTRMAHVIDGVFNIISGPKDQRGQVWSSE